MAEETQKLGVDARAPEKREICLQHQRQACLRENDSIVTGFATTDDAEVSLSSVSWTSSAHIPMTVPAPSSVERERGRMTKIGPACQAEAAKSARTRSWSFSQYRDMSSPHRRQNKQRFTGRFVLRSSAMVASLIGWSYRRLRTLENRARPSSKVLESTYRAARKEESS